MNKDTTSVKTTMRKKKGDNPQQSAVKSINTKSTDTKGHGIRPNDANNKNIVKVKEEIVVVVGSGGDYGQKIMVEQGNTTGASKTGKKGKKGKKGGKKGKKGKRGKKKRKTTGFFGLFSSSKKKRGKKGGKKSGKKKRRRGKKKGGKKERLQYNISSTENIAMSTRRTNTAPKAKNTTPNFPAKKKKREPLLSMFSTNMTGIKRRHTGKRKKNGKRQRKGRKRRRGGKRGGKKGGKKQPDVSSTIPTKPKTAIPPTSKSRKGSSKVKQVVSDSKRISRQTRATSSSSATSIFQRAYDRIDTVNTAVRCARYGLDVLSATQVPRRLFFGSMLADESMEILDIHAVETHSLYDVIAFVESNTTHSAAPRILRFDSDKIQKNLARKFGAPVFLDFFLDKAEGAVGMVRESVQRDRIRARWIQQGMTPNDVGIMADVDEVPSRDFLWAIRLCDFPEFRPGQTCEAPKVVPETLQWEASPKCLKKKTWFHPDFISGQCIEGIGNATARPIVQRDYLGKFGQRTEEEIQRLNDHKISGPLYPLFNGPDIRTYPGSREERYNFVERPGETITHAYGTAYHFHNWFESFQTLRNKYLTYAHMRGGVMRKQLSLLEVDVDVMVRCAKGYASDANPNGEPYYQQYPILASTPIYFLNQTYIDHRHDQLLRSIHQDEQKYGSTYSSDGVWTWEDPSARGTYEYKEEQEEKYDSNKDVESQILNSLAVSRLRNITSRLREQQGSASPKLNGVDTSANATVMGMALGVDDNNMEIFVGSLRRSGFKGHIILGVAEGISKDMIQYLKNQNATVKYLNRASCTYPRLEVADEEGYDSYNVCVKPYLDLKANWAKYPLGLDWLRECKSCEGPVLFTDIENVYFQKNPFGPTAPKVEGLQFFEEHPDVRTTHWLVSEPIRQCKGDANIFDESMLFSGATVGTLSSMKKYLSAMYGEMKEWMADSECRSKMERDDQALLNWLYYTGSIEKSESVKYRSGLVFTVGYEVDIIRREHVRVFSAAKQLDGSEPDEVPLVGSDETIWISAEFGLSDSSGFFINVDGARPAMIHQSNIANNGFQTWFQQRYQ